MPDGDALRFPGMDGAEYCPVSIGAKLIGDRWSLLIVRELMSGASRFNEIHRGLPGLSKSLLSSRLRTLVRHGIVEHDRDGGSYTLTAAGADLQEVVAALGAWTVRWRFPPPSGADVDSALLLWRIYQGIDPARLPPHRVTVEFALAGAIPGHGWLVLDGAESSLCMDPPGHNPDIVVHGSVPAWLAVWFGHRTYADAVAAGDLVPEGPPHLVAQLPGWFTMSPFRPAVAALRQDSPDGTSGS